MKGLTIGSLAPATRGIYFGDTALLEREISFITTDSREAGPGCLFAAIKGENSDGHDFVDSAFEKGAICAIVERKLPQTEGALLAVSSTYEALAGIARLYRSQFDIPVVAVTGSVGKTTTKETIAAVLSRRFKTLKTEKNFNNELGVPKTIFRLERDDEAAVLELGINHFGEMTRLAQMARPDIAVFTNIGFSHLEFLENRQGVLRAKSELLSGMTDSGVVIVNGDDELLREMDCAGRRKLIFGTTGDCDVRAEGFRQLGAGGSVCDIVTAKGRFSVKTGAFGAHMVYAALAAAAVGLELGLGFDEIAAGIADYEPVGSRARVLDTGYCTVIDDCYNANPVSVVSAIASMDGLGGRRVCILGDMLELGEASGELHYSVGSTAGTAGIDLLLAAGERSEETVRGARAGGIAAWHFPNKEELISVLPQYIQKGDAVLVKASRGMRFEEIVAVLTELM